MSAPNGLHGPCDYCGEPHTTGFCEAEPADDDEQSEPEEQPDETDYIEEDPFEEDDPPEQMEEDEPPDEEPEDLDDDEPYDPGADDEEPDEDPANDNDVDDEEAAIAACDIDYEDDYEDGAWIGTRPTRAKGKTAKPTKGDDRPVVKISAELYDNATASIGALARRAEDLGVYEHTRRLVQVTTITPEQAAKSPVVSVSMSGEERHALVVGLIRFLGHLERGGYDGSDDGEWFQAGRQRDDEVAPRAA